MRARKDGQMVEAVDIGVGGGIGAEPTFIEWVRQRVPADEVPGMIADIVEATPRSLGGPDHPKTGTPVERNEFADDSEPEEVSHLA